MEAQDALAAGLACEIPAPLEKILELLAEGWPESDQTDRVVGLLDAYVAQVEHIAEAADKLGADGLLWVCGLIEGHLSRFRMHPESMSADEQGLLFDWPIVLTDFMALPTDPVVIGALIGHLEDPRWSSPLAADEAVSLRRKFGLDDIAANVAIDEERAGALTLPDMPATGTEMLIGSPQHDDNEEVSEPVATTAETLSTGTFAKINYTTQLAWSADLAERKGLLGLCDVCLRVQQHLAHWEAQSAVLGEAECKRLDHGLTLIRAYLAAPGNAHTAEALVADLRHPGWPDPIDAEQAEMVQALLLAVESEHADEDDSNALPFSIAADQSPAIPSATPEDRVDAVSVDRLPESVDASAQLVSPALAEQVVSADLLKMLADEALGMTESLDEALSRSISGENESARREASELYVELIGRLAVAAEAVGLAALKQYLESVQSQLSANPESLITGSQSDLLPLLPGLITTYLATPNDPSIGEGMVDMLRNDVWPQPIEATHGAELARSLAAVEVSKDVAAIPDRQVEAKAEDASVALPETVSQELLDGLLLDLQTRTTDFSAAIQRIAAGEGSLEDVDLAKRSAHTLKGAASTVGVKGVANLTHHLEDILIAFAKYEKLPSGALSESLTRSADCLEAMTEAVMGAGPEPDDALAVLQDILNWANRIDREGIPESGDQAEAESQTREAQTPAAEEASAAAAQSAGPMVRVPATLIDEMLRLVGETMISTTQIRDRLRRAVRQSETVQGQNGAFLNLANELEHLVDIRGIAAPSRTGVTGEEFDSLEFEHYSELHTVSRRLVEAATDSRELGLGVKDDLFVLNELIETQERLHLESRAVVMRTRMVPVATIVSRLQRSVRQACRVLGKRVAMDVVGAETLVDGNILNDLVDPLMHMLRNAVDHGIDSLEDRKARGKASDGRIVLTFSREGNHVVVRCQDDGNGLDLAAIRRTAEAKGLVSADQILADDELSRLILKQGFSTRTQATEVSGRGIGMDVVYSRVLEMKGALNLRSQSGKGLLVELRVPAALLSTHALLVQLPDQTLAVSSRGIEDIHYVTNDKLQTVGTSLTYRVGDNLYPVADLSDLIAASAGTADESRSGFPMLILRQDSGAALAIRVPQIIDSRDLVVKGLGRHVPKVQGVLGATILGDGGVAPVLDLPELMRAPVSGSGSSGADREAEHNQYSQQVARGMLTALVVDDSLSARRATAQFMKDAGFEVRTAIDGMEAVSVLDKWVPDILLVDMEMPRMNGLELSSHARARKELSNIPIIMITSRSTEKHRKQAQSVGVNVYLTKPFSDDELLRHVTELTAV